LTLATLSAGILLHAAAPPAPQGLITGKAFTGITGTAVTALTGNAKFPNAPDQIFYLPYFEWNATGDIFTPPGNWADNYGSQIRGYFYPPTTGDYVFYLAADDNAELHLSTDGDPANKKLIARESVWSNPREYLISGGASDLTAKDSSTFTGTQWPVLDPVLGGAKITLQAGQPYYIEALAKEGTGGDNLSVAAFDVTGGTLDSTLPIPGQYLSSDRSNGPVSIVTPPASQSVPERGGVTFTVVADGTPPYTYQWKRNGENIPDATAISYTLPSAMMTDNGATFSVTVTGAEGGGTTSTAGTLTVIPDTVAPTLLGAKGLPNLTEVILSFSEALDPVSAATTGNYQITSAGGALNISAATLSPGGTQVTLTTAAQALGTKYTLVVNGVRDSAATPNTVAAGSRAIFFPAGKLMQDDNGFVVFEAENYDRNSDGRWVINTTRGTPSGGASVVVPNGAGGNESGTQLEYDVEFKQAGTYYVWYRASGNDGNDDSSWLWLDGARPAERDPANGAAANSASMTGFSGQLDFVWRSDSQDGPDPFTVDIATPGPHVIALARREDGAFHDKFILTLDPAFTPTGVGPAETRPGAPGTPTVALTAPTAGQTFTAGADIQLSATAAGQSGLEITRVEFSANGALIGTVTGSPFNFTWNDVAAGPYSLRAVAFDELGQSTATENLLITVEEAGPKTSARIAWVSFHRADDAPSAAAATAGFTSASDIGYTDLITASGHQITRIVTSGTPDVALLNAFDLVIISRAVPSGDYQDPPETAAWNGITAPVMLLGATPRGPTVSASMLATPSLTRWDRSPSPLATPRTPSLRGSPSPAGSRPIPTRMSSVSWARSSAASRWSPILRPGPASRSPPSPRIRIPPSADPSSSSGRRATPWPTRRPTPWAAIAWCS